VVPKHADEKKFLEIKALSVIDRNEIVKGKEEMENEQTSRQTNYRLRTESAILRHASRTQKHRNEQTPHTKQEGKKIERTQYRTHCATDEDPIIDIHQPSPSTFIFILVHLPTSAPYRPSTYKRCRHLERLRTADAALHAALIAYEDGEIGIRTAMPRAGLWIEGLCKW
jgi:hypothetical protein